MIGMWEVATRKGHGALRPEKTAVSSSARVSAGPEPVSDVRKGRKSGYELRPNSVNKALAHRGTTSNLI
jgi:hypothetical protein